MGMVNRDLVVREHGARAHAQALSGIFGRLAPTATTTTAPLPEMARLIRNQWRTEARARELEQSHREASIRLATLESDHTALGSAHAALDSAHASLAAEHAELRYRHDALVRLTSTRRHRAGLRLGAWADAVRRIISGSA
jgi:hypothetical protein